VRAALAAGGCTASRAAIVGACVAARGGAVPDAWLARAHGGPAALRLAAAVVAKRAGGTRVALAAMARATAAEHDALSREFGLTYEVNAAFDAAFENAFA